MNIVAEVNHWVQTTGLELLIALVVAFAVRHIGGALIIYLVNHGVRDRKFGRKLSKNDLKKRRDTLKSMLTVIWRVIVVIVTVIVMLGIALPGVELAPLLASAGVIGLAIGFGAQEVVKDFITGLFIIIENQYRVGDYVDIDGHEGTVERLTIRLTVLRAFDGRIYFITNGSIQYVANMTLEHGEVCFGLRLDPTTSIDKLVKVINDVGDKLSQEAEWKHMITEKPGFFRITKLTGTYVEVYVLGKTTVANHWAVEGELRRRLLTRLDQEGIKLADLPVSLIES